MTGIPMAAAALAGVPAGVQAHGVWAGRRQLFIRFAGEAETATMYTAAALVREIERQLSRSKFHSISIGGRDPLANQAFLVAAFEAAKPSLSRHARYRWPAPGNSQDARAIHCACPSDGRFLVAGCHARARDQDDCRGGEREMRARTRSMSARRYIRRPTAARHRAGTRHERGHADRNSSAVSDR